MTTCIIYFVPGGLQIGLKYLGYVAANCLQQPAVLNRKVELKEGLDGATTTHSFREFIDFCVSFRGEFTTATITDAPVLPHLTSPRL